MTNEEVVAVLQMIAQSLRAQAVHLRNLHEAHESLYDALKLDHPQLEDTFRAEMTKIRPIAHMQWQLEHLDALFQSVGISQ